MTRAQSQLDLIVGVFVLSGLAAVAFLALKIGRGTLLDADTYIVRARFTNISGLNPGSNIVVSGVSVGRVEAVHLNPADYSATVDLRLRKEIRLPVDSIVSVKTSGLIGDKYLAISPGADSRMLSPDGLVVDTESTVDLESLISRFAFGSVQTNQPKETK